LGWCAAGEHAAGAGDRVGADESVEFTVVMIKLGMPTPARYAQTRQMPTETTLVRGQRGMLATLDQQIVAIENGRKALERVTP